MYMQNISRIHEDILEIYDDTHFCDIQTDRQTDRQTDGHDSKAKTKASRAPLCATNNINPQPTISYLYG